MNSQRQIIAIHSRTSGDYYSYIFLCGIYYDISLSSNDVRAHLYQFKISFDAMIEQLVNRLFSMQHLFESITSLQYVFVMILFTDVNLELPG